MWHLEPVVIFQLRQNHGKSDFFCPKNEKQLVTWGFIFVTGNSPLHFIVSADFRNCTEITVPWILYITQQNI